MKISVKILCAILALTFILPLSLTSCKKEEVEAEPLVICENGASHYAFVHPDKTNPTLTKTLFAVRDTIKDKTGVTMIINSDWVRPGDEVPTGTKEILIGDTNRPESKQAASELKAGSYLIKVYGERIAIVADGDKLLIEAVNYFVDTYITSAKDKVSVPSDLVYLKTADGYMPATDNGDGTVTLKLDTFVVVYDSASKQKYAAAVAKAFASRAAKKYSVLGATEDATVNKYEILFGACDREQFKTTSQKFMFRDFFVVYSDNKLSVSANSIYGYENAINFLIDGFGEKGITISKDGEYKEYDYGNSEYADIFKNFDNPTADGAWMINVSHRGDYVTNSNPENSILAYQSCVDNRIDVIETDLQKTKDGVWVICHDSKIDRTTDGSGDIKNMTYEELMAYNLKEGQGGKNAAVTTHKMPTLEEIIEVARGKCLFNLDKLTPDMFQEVYDVFEKENAVDSAMFKTSKMPAKDLIKWFADLIEDGRKLPVFCPMIYSKTVQAEALAFKGLASMLETSLDLNNETLTYILNECGIRSMCLTALNLDRENFDFYQKLKDVGYTAIMTDRTVQLKEFIHGK